MKLEIISDTHGMHRGVEMSGGDIAIHAGDFTARNTEEELAGFAQWYGSQSHEWKFVICGNHDSDSIPKETYKKVFSEHGILYMQDEAFTVNGLNMYFSPWTPTFYNWHWMKDRGPQMREMTDKIPLDTNVLITHGPQFGVMDETEEGLNVGCEQLHRRITQLSDLKLHCFGHIHEAYGREDVLKGGHYSHESINASIVNRQYRPVNKPVVVEL